MKVDIRHVEKTHGLVFRKTLHGVALTVTFSEEERHIIRARRLERVCIIERGAPAGVNPERHANRGVTRKLATAAVGGYDALTFDLTIGKLVKGTDTYYFHKPIDAKEYEAELRDSMPKLKAYIAENAEIEQKSDSFEL